MLQCNVSKQHHSIRKQGGALVIPDRLSRMQACCYLATRLARPVPRAVLPRLAADFLVGMISASVSAAVSSRLSEASPPASCCSFNRLPLLLAATCLASGSAVWVAGVFLFLGACFCFASSGSSALPSSVSLALSDAPTDAFLLFIALLGAAVQTEVAASVAAVHQESGSNRDHSRSSCDRYAGARLRCYDAG